MVLPEEDLHVQVTGWGWARCPGRRGGQAEGKHGHHPEHPATGVSAGHLQVGAGGAAGQEGVQPEGPERMEKEADLQVTLPRGVSIAGCRGWVGLGACQAQV